MKPSLARLNPRRALPSWGTPLAATLAALLASNSFAQVRPALTNEYPDLDDRTSVPLSSQDFAAQQTGLTSLSQQLSSAGVDFDRLLGTPKFIRASDGFLSGPDAQGRAISPAATQSIPSNDPYRPVKAFLVDHAALCGYGPEILDGARVTRDYTDARNGLRTVAWEQKLDGIPVFQSLLLGNITRNSELVSLSTLFVPAPAAAADGGTPNRAAIQAAPPVGSVDAVRFAAQNVGDNLAPGAVVSAGGPAGDGSYLPFHTPRPAYARLVWLPLNRSSMVLGWEVILDGQAAKTRFRVVVDAQTGAVRLRQNLTRYISDVTYNVYTSDSPSPFTPGLPAPGNFQPPLVSRTLVTTPALDTTASPNGWINDGDNTTTGNNTDTFVDRNFDGQPDRPRPVGNPNRVFNFTNDLTLDPTNYIDASTVQLFYWVNWYHDKLYELGFTEAAGNYQIDNFGRGGIGGDNIIGYVQAGADIGFANNAFFVPAPDGINGQIAMFTWTGPTPNRDGSLDADVILHEATHGTSERLVGAGVLISALQTGGMGEGWSDFYALSLNSQVGDDPDATYPAGGYASYRLGGLTANYYYGIRHFPYCTDMSKDPFTFKDIDPAQISPHAGVPRSPIYPFNPNEADEVHHQGEVWCVTLWEVRANLIHKYGFSGSQLMLQLVTDAMKLGPANPNFLQARDAILLADRVDNGGANIGEIWRGFAKRGMGFSATSPASSTTVGVFEAFDVPGLQVDHVVVSGGNGNGQIDFNECNSLQIFLRNSSGSDASGVVATLSSATPGVQIAQPVSPYPFIPNGATNANLNLFKVSTAPAFACGTTIEFTLLIKSDLTTTTNQFALQTGSPGKPLRFDNFTPVFIPDVSETNSPIAVSNVTFAIKKITVSLFLTHTFDSDLLLQLISPDNITNNLSANRGGSGDNYGIVCTPDSFRTTFDDDASTPIGASGAPFVGSFKPEQPLSRFIGKSGTNANGTWRLRIVDQAAIDVGTLHCWSLFVTPSVCSDGGGECPGSDLTVGMLAQPEPVIIGGNLTYIVSITNKGPSTASSVTLSQVLPNSAVFVSATPSQGSFSQSGGVLTCNLGPMSSGAKASVVVVVLPTTPGILSSTATVSSEQPDPNPSDNSATVFTHCNPATADVGVGLAAAPASSVVGGSLTYNVSVTNYGPGFASQVTVTNIIPSAMAFVSASVSQGSVTTVGNQVICSFGTLLIGGRATAAISVIPSADGTFVASSRVVANEIDPIAGNNNSSVTTVVGPSADLALVLTDSPDPVLMGSNLVYTVVVGNHGPSSAANVSVNTLLPGIVTLVSNFTTQGSIAVANNSAIASLGTLPVGAVATNIFLVSAPFTDSNVVLSASANVSGSQSDPVPGNNTAAVTTLLASPFVSITPAGASLLVESVSPPDGSIQNNETVTVALRLRNAGNIAATNLVATLLSGNGIAPVPPNNPQTYALLQPSPLDFAVSNIFAFTASGANGGTVTAVLQLTNGSGFHTNINFDFTLPNVVTFANTAPIAIRDTNSASPYPSTINVSGLNGIVGKVSVTLSNLNHTFARDIDALLVNPVGQDTILMSGAGYPFGVNAFLTFDDAASSALPASSQLVTGSYRPADYLPGTNLPPAAPAGPYVASMSALNGASPNGLWALYVDDHSRGDTGSVAGGWGLSLTLVTPVNQTADLAVTGVGAPSPVFAGTLLTNVFTITNRGPNGALDIAFTNPLPAGVAFSSASASQGSVGLVGTNVVGSLGALDAAGSATVAVVVTPGPAAAGFLTNTASVFATSGEIDLNPANNAGSIITSVVLPAANLVAGQSAAPNPVTVGSNVTFSLTVTNNGPQTALSARLTNVLGAGVSFVSSVPAPNTVSAGTLVWNLGDLGPNAGATISLVATPSVVGPATNRVSASSASAEGAPADNSTNLVLTVANRAPLIVAAGASLTQEGGPINGAIDPGELVTVQLSLQNVGSADTSPNLTATLLTNGNVIPIGLQSQGYGALHQGGAAVARAFTFSNSASAGAVLTATLQLQDGATNLGTLSFVFPLPVNSAFVSSAIISIPDHGIATPYPSTLTISDATGVVGKVTVTLSGFTHTFPRDVSALLVSPAGASAVLIAHAGGAHSVTNLTLTFADAAANTLPTSDALASGSYQPGDLPGPNGLAAFLPPAPSRPYAPALSGFEGQSPNGTWSLYVLDDSQGDAGSIVGGWTLNLTVITPLNPLADLALNLVSQPSGLYVGDSLTNTLLVTNLGPSTATGVLVTNTLPAGLSYLSSTASQGSCSNVGGGKIVASLGPLAPGAGAAFTIVASASSGLTMVDFATVSGNELDLNLANNLATAVIMATNASATLQPSISAGHFTFSANVPSGLSYVVLTSSNLTAWQAVSTNTSAAGVLKYTDPAPPSAAHKFYRTSRLGQ